MGKGGGKGQGAGAGGGGGGGGGAALSTALGADREREREMGQKDIGQKAMVRRLVNTLRTRFGLEQVLHRLNPKT